MLDHIYGVLDLRYGVLDYIYVVQDHIYGVLDHMLYCGHLIGQHANICPDLPVK